MNIEAIKELQVGYIGDLIDVRLSLCQNAFANQNHIFGKVQLSTHTHGIYSLDPLGIAKSASSR